MKHLVHLISLVQPLDTWNCAALYAWLLQLLISKQAMPATEGLSSVTQVTLTFDLIMYLQWRTLLLI